MKIDNWTERFAGTASLPQAVQGRLIKVARITKIKAREVIFSPADTPDILLFLYRGRIKVSQSLSVGREIVLYRITAGESCVLNTACIIAGEAFRQFVFAAYSRRLIDLLRVVDDVAFGRMDMRLAERLLSLVGDRNDIQTTHQMLASELGTAREVISHVLIDFQNEI